MEKKKHIINIAFGEQVADALNYGRKLTKEEISMHVKRYEFCSKTEAKSFLYGIDQAMGWFDYYVMDESDIKNLPKKWHKEIEVNKIAS
jgi:hypothetical protein